MPSLAPSSSDKQAKPPGIEVLDSHAVAAPAEESLKSVQLPQAGILRREANKEFEPEFTPAGVLSGLTVRRRVGQVEDRLHLAFTEGPDLRQLQSLIPGGQGSWRKFTAVLLTHLGTHATWIASRHTRPADNEQATLHHHYHELTAHEFFADVRFESTVHIARPNTQAPLEAVVMHLYLHPSKGQACALELWPSEQQRHYKNARPAAVFVSSEHHYNYAAEVFLDHFMATGVAGLRNSLLQRKSGFKEASRELCSFGIRKLMLSLLATDRALDPPKGRAQAPKKSADGVIELVVSRNEEHSLRCALSRSPTDLMVEFRNEKSGCSLNFSFRRSLGEGASWLRRAWVCWRERGLINKLKDRLPQLVSPEHNTAAVEALLRLKPHVSETIGSPQAEFESLDCFHNLAMAQRSILEVGSEQRTIEAIVADHLAGRRVHGYRLYGADKIVEPFDVMLIALDPKDRGYIEFRLENRLALRKELDLSNPKTDQQEYLFASAVTGFCAQRSAAHDAAIAPKALEAQKSLLESLSCSASVARAVNAHFLSRLGRGHGFSWKVTLPAKGSSYEAQLRCASYFEIGFSLKVSATKRPSCQSGVLRERLERFWIRDLKKERRFEWTFLPEERIEFGVEALIKQICFHKSYRQARKAIRNFIGQQFSRLYSERRPYI